MNPEPIFDLAHLGHMELLTPKPDESLKFFVDVMGMTESGRKGESVYLRGWDDYERYSLKLTASKTSGMEHMALRARSPQALERRVAALKGSGFDIGWVEGDMGQGPAFRCRDPDGHIVELYYETEWYQAPPELKPALKNQAQRFPARGVNVRPSDDCRETTARGAARSSFHQHGRCGSGLAGRRAGEPIGSASSAT